MRAYVWFTTWLSDLIDELPDDVVEQLTPEEIQRIRDEGLHELPKEIVNRLPDSVVDRISPELIESASRNLFFTLLLVMVGLVAVAGFLWGVSKSAFKAAVFFAVVAAGSWFYLFAG